MWLDGQIIASAKRKGKTSAFSLLELLVVMAIMAAVGAASIPFSVGFIRSMKLSSAAGELAGLIEEARSRALAGQSYIWLGLSQDSVRNGVWVVLFDSGKAPSSLASDLRPVSKPVLLEGVALKEAAGLPGVQGLPAVSDSSIDDLATVPSGTGPDAFVPIENTMGLGGASSFDRLVLFSPRGEAMARKNNYARWIMIGIAQQNGSMDNAAVFQISGLTAQCITHRP